jgi:sulfur-carrier protein
MTSPAPVTIRVRLPAHLRQLARCEREVSVEAEPTQRGVLGALEQRYPALRGTLRDPATDRRRPFVRFYACEQDLSHESPDTVLPAAVIDGTEPFLIIGAMAGG